MCRRTSPGAGQHGGWKCNADIQSQQKAEALAPITASANGCTNVQPGDTIEVHWIFSSCNVQPGEGLGACLSAECVNPQLRVEAAVYLLVNDDQAIDFGQFDYHTIDRQTYHQPTQLPDAK
ncbi:delta-class carbonic anhydrase [Candidatus Entotheonella palauensis]|uniref:delta-class carbonic anhydrase n=1 Tax=Candidatus Entotheonella palauensis TaxID=93172 RepID=UPI0015C4BF1E|nr:delta-class carbonic anhydrase [Candidatus Entotheonella palauensis]